MTALRAFEAAARLGSFADAATELGVTASAITAQIKGLEADLGAKLFERSSKGVTLTGVAERSLPELNAAFDALATASKTLRAEAAPQTVHIVTLPAIAQLWLSPRLPALRSAAPEISISITAMEAPPNLKRTPYDLSLFYADSGQLIAQDFIYPVCAPSVAARLGSPADLEGETCLSDSTWRDDWRLWADHALAGRSFTPRGPVFSLYALAVEEAAGGAGVLMGHHALVATHLAVGALVAPFAEKLRLAKGLRLWSARHLAPGSAAFRVARFLQTAAERG